MTCEPYNGTTAALPPLYQRWAEDLLGAIPSESEATCLDCSMCSATEDHHESAGYSYDPLVKCCSYVPMLPNFLVGRVLDDADPAMAGGRHTVLQRLEAEAEVTPLWVRATAGYRAIYEQSPGFGRSATLLCPHFDRTNGGRCSIWRHRDAVCSTFFCKHARGAVGQRFWSALRDLLVRVEHDLALSCLLELEPAPEALELLDLHGRPTGGLFGPAGSVTPHAHQALWGRWHQRPEALFRSCGELVADLSGEQVLARCGPQVTALLALARRAHTALLSATLPHRLRTGAFEIVQLSADSCQVVTYGPDDPLRLPRDLVDLLHLFDGRPLEEVLQLLRERERVELDLALVRKLVDFELLVPARRLS